MALARNGEKDIRATWNEKTSLEKLCTGAVTITSFLGLGLYLVSVSNKAGGATEEAWRYLLITGWTLGCAGHIMGMLGNFIKGGREDFEARRHAPEAVNLA